METFEFTIVASGLDPSADDFERRFYDAGCDDATISFQKGHVIVDFARETESVETALATALAAVAAAGARIDRVEPDPLVSLADMAARTGMTRAAMTHYAKGRRAEGFPTPVARVTSDSPLWDWASVSRWLQGRRKVTHSTVVQAEAVKRANDMISTGRLDETGPLDECRRALETGRSV